MIRTLLALAALLLAPAAAQAKDKGLDPAAAYVVIDIENLDDALLQGTDQPGNVTLGRYDPEKQDIRGGELSPGTKLPGKASPHVGIAKKPVVKRDRVRQYVVEVEPDTWVIEGASGTAFSLGSVQFEVKPGEVIDLGVAKPAVDLAEGEKAMSAGDLMLKALVPFGSMRPKNIRPVWLDLRARGADDLPLPAVLAGRAVTPAEFASGAKFGNYLGGLVNRIGGRKQRFRELQAENGTLVAEAPPAEPVPD